MADEEDSLAKKVHQQKPDSPVPSYVSMRSDQSHDGLIDFKHGHHSTDQRVHQQKPESPVPSYVSMRSDQSHDGLIDFKHGHHSTDQRVHQQKPDSPVPCCVSMRSDQSHDGLIDFKHGHHSTDQRVHQQKPHSPVTSYVSMRSDQSHDGLIDFKHGHHSTDQRVHQQKPDSPVPSYVSMRSDQSHDGLIDFKHGHHSTDQRVHQQKPDSPVPSCVSMRSDQSHDGLIDFKHGHHSTDQRVHQQKPDSPAPSCVSMSSDWSKDGNIIDFKDGHHSTDQRVHQQRPDSPAPSSVSMSSDWSKDGNIIDFKDGHHSTDQRVHQQRPDSPAPSSVSMSSDWSKDGNIIDFKDGHNSTDQRTDQQKSGDLKGQPDQADKSDRKKKLSEDLKKRILDKCEKTIPATRTDAHLYILKAENEDTNKDKEGGKSVEKKTKKKVKQIKYDQIFDSRIYQKKRRIVLTKGETGIGKTFQSQCFMVDWAKNMSNKDIDFLFSLNFAELNSKIVDHQSLEELLHHFFKEAEQSGIPNYEKHKITFILDDLDQCQLPLDFDKNRELTDITEKASVDVLLTNLIKGNLLPSARLWIISRPAAADKIPLQYIDTVTECGDEYIQHCLQSHLKKRIQDQEFEKRMPKKLFEAPIYITDNIKGKESNEQEDGQSETTSKKKGSQTTYDKIFKSTSWFRKKIRTVLTTGNAGVGKTLQAQRFMSDWANGKSNQDTDFLFPLNFAELNSTDENLSLNELLHNFFKESKQSGIPQYEKHKITFILDDLDQCQLPLDFDKNRELTDITEKASVDVLLTNLIKGNLLPSACLWIISRPAAADKIPLQYIDTVTECGDEYLRHCLQSHLKKRIQDQEFEKRMPKKLFEAPIYITDNIKGKESNEQEDGQSETTSKKKGSQTTYDKIFKSTSWFRKKIRTVLTTGNAGVGKTLQAQRFMSDWANGKSNQDTDFLFPLNFAELNSTDENLSLNELLHNFFKESKQSGIPQYEKHKITFILDDLDQCQLPLDFDKNRELTDITEKASVDVLLTNLIKGNLLPSACLWIISRPAAADKIPLQYIDTVTECGDEYLRHCLQSHLKKRIQDQEFEKRMPKKLFEAPIYITDNIKGKESNEQEDGQSETTSKKKGSQTTYDKIFKSTSWFRKKIRTVLTTGNAGVGKTLQAQRFMSDWANGKSNQDTDFLFPLNFAELNSTDENLSLNELLHNFFKESKQSGIPQYEKHKITFILDDLDQCQLPLDFDKNRELTDITEKASVDVLLTNLIKGNLLPSACLWIISRPAAADKIPLQYIDTVTECGDEYLRHCLQSHLKKRIQDQEFEKRMPKKLFEAPIYITDNIKGKESNEQEDGQSETTSKKKGSQTTYDKIFKSTSRFRKKIRTVLTTGIAGVGKTLQAQRFMSDWANGKSNQDTDFLFPLNFAELNSTDENLSLNELLHNFFKESKQSGIPQYEKHKVTFILDDLDQCRPPLDFDKNPKLTDITEKASVDVLLTNLIKGNLLPSACLWIISRPAAADRIPLQYIDTVTECGDKHLQVKLASNQRMRILDLLKHQLAGNEIDTHLQILEAEKEEANNDCKDGLIQTTATKLFERTRPKMIRTLLTKGVASIGKTFQTQKFMLDWANEESNKETELLFPLKFAELNARADKDQSFIALLHHFFEDAEQSGVSHYDKYNLTFILDGLEQCKLPLNFNNPVLTDIREPASMDMLLTNLIKGNLLPSARLWIISRPAATDKIPLQYIDTVTECRESLERRKQLSSSIRKKLNQEIRHTEDPNHPNQKNTEHIIRVSSSEELSKDHEMGPTERSTTNKRLVMSISDMFQPGKNGPIRTVLTKGEAGIGKTFLVQKSILEWARGETKKDTGGWAKLMKTISGKDRTKGTELIFPLTFSTLNFVDVDLSLVGLLNHFFEQTKMFVISNYAEVDVMFIFEDLDLCQLPLDFDNNPDLTDIREPAPVDEILTNLIKGNLLPSARVWITSRPEAAHKISPQIDAGDHSDTEIREKPDVASQRKLKSFLTERFRRVFEGLFKHTNSALLNEIYTDLYIIEGGTGDVNHQNEVRQIEGAAFKPEETPILYFNIFKPRSGKEIRTVLTNGVAGIGKTIASQKYMLDWAEEKSNQETYYTFPFLFRELNLKKEEQYSLEGLIHEFFPEMKTSEIDNYDKYKILLVLDGLDEWKHDLNFNSDICKDVREKTSVNVLLVNLIQGNLLSTARLWITSRPAASSRIPPEHIDLVTEVRGFNDPQKEEYFRKRFSDKELANKIISHLTKSRSLHILCHIPVFCWITATVLEDMLSTDENRESTKQGEIPKTLTDMLIHFLVLQCRQGNVKYHKTNDTSKTDEPDKSHDSDDSDGSFKSTVSDQLDEIDDPDSCWNSENKDLVLALGKLAFEELEKGNLVFVEQDLTSRGIDITEAVVYSGLFTQISRDDDLFPRKMYSFVHLSIQEFLAALYRFLKFSNRDSYRKSDQPASTFYKCAVDKALDSSNGDWDLFLRFLLGFLLETNQKLLHGLLKLTVERKSHRRKAKLEIIAYIKEKIKGMLNADRSINLFHCLNELGDHSLVEEIKKYLSSDSAPFKDFSSSQWSAMTYVLLMSDENLEVFDLKKYLKSEHVLLGMLPVVKFAKTALLSRCDLSQESCKGLASSILSSSSANLTELNLSDNDLLDVGIKELSEGLRMPQCKLKILKISGCQVTEKGCSFLGSALTSNPNHLTELDLSYNHPGDSGVLTAIKNDESSALEILRLDHGGEHRLKPGWLKYAVDLILDINTASQKLILSEGNRKARRKTKVEEKVQYPDHPDRFRRTQVLCEQGLTERCYWEVELKGAVGIAVAYRRVNRYWDSSGGLGSNDASWSLICSEEKSKFTSNKPKSDKSREYIARHDKETTVVESDPSQKIAVFLDWEGGTLEYYSVSEGTLTHIHTFQAQFTEPLYPGFWFKKGSVSLCQVCGDDSHVIST